MLLADKADVRSAERLDAVPAIVAVLKFAPMVMLARQDERIEEHDRRIAAVESYGLPNSDHSKACAAI
jgi:hypothetical protein